MMPGAGCVPLVTFSTVCLPVPQLDQLSSKGEVAPLGRYFLTQSHCSDHV